MVCYNCRKKGHIARSCRTKVVQGGRTFVKCFPKEEFSSIALYKLVGKTILVSGKVNTVDITFILNSGPSVSLVTKDIASFVRTLDAIREIANGDYLPIQGKVKLKVAIAQYRCILRLQRIRHPHAQRTIVTYISLSEAILIHSKASTHIIPLVDKSL